MIRYLRPFYLCCAVVLMSACATSTQPKLYTLSTPLSNEQTETLQPVLKPVQQWTAVSVQVPDRLKRPQLVLNKKDGTGVVMLEHDRWASAFNDELRDAIISGIHQHVIANAASQQPHYRINVTLLQMDTLLDDHITANFRWSMTNTDSKVKLSCDFNTSANITDGVSGAVTGTQAIVHGLVKAIVMRMQAVNAGEVGSC